MCFNVDSVLDNMIIFQLLNLQVISGGSHSDAHLFFVDGHFQHKTEYSAG